MALWCTRGTVRLPVLLAVLLTIPSVVWVIIDRSIWAWDPAWYGQVSIELWAALKASPSAWMDSLQSAFASKPPGIAWLGEFFVPLRRILGAPEPAMLLSIVATQFVTLLLTYGAVWRIWRRRSAAALAMLVLAGAPLFVALSRSYFAEPLQAAAVAWAVFVLASARQRHPALTVVQVPGVVALGLLAKLSSPIYVVLPLIAALIVAFWGPVRWRVPRWYLSPALIASAAASGLLVVGSVAWYRRNIDAALTHARFSAESDLWGTRGAFVHDWFEWLARLWDASFLPGFGAAALILLAAGWWVGRGRGDAGQRSQGFPLGVVAVGVAIASVVLILASFALAVNDEGRYMLPLLVFGALAIGGLATRAGGVTPYVCGIAAIQAAVVLLVPFVSSGLPQEPSARLVAPDYTPVFRDRLTQLVAQTCAPSTNGRISVVGPERPWLNANTLTMYSADAVSTSGRTCPYTSLGFAETSPQRAWERLLALNAPFFISLDFGNPRNRLPAALAADAAKADVFNAVDRAVFLRAVRSGTFERVPGSARDGVVVLQRH